MSSELRPVVGFVFTFTRKRVRTREDLQNEAAIVVQTTMIRVACRAIGAELVGLKLAETTYRGQVFTDDIAFKEAVAEAKAKSAVLFIADIFGSLRTVNLKAASRCFEMLDRAGVEIFNAADARPWGSYTRAERQHRQYIASLTTTQRSKAIKAGLAGRPASPQAPLAARQKRGAASGATKADRRAKALAAVVREIVDAAKPDPVSHSRLARELNDRGVEAAKSGSWSPVTAKRLRLRLQALGLLEGEEIQRSNPSREDFLPP